MNKDNKILIIANAPITKKSIGGGDRFIIETTPYLAKKLAVTVLTPQFTLSHWKKPLKKINFIFSRKTIFDNSDNKLAIAFAYLLRIIHTLSLLPKIESDLIISATPLLPDIIPVFIYKIFKRNILWICRIYQLVPPPKGRPGKYFVNLITFLHQKMILHVLKKADLILSDNQLMINKLKEIGLNPQKIKLLYNGADIETIQQYKHQKKYQIDACYIGRLDSNKGIFDLVPIWKAVVNKLPQAVLGIAGYGPLEITDKLKIAIRKACLKDNVNFVGYLPHEEKNRKPLFDFLLSAKVLLLPEYEGGTPLTILEALASEIPVVAYQRPELSDLHLDNLFLIPQQETALFGQKVVSLLNNRQRPRKKPLFSLDRFDWKNISKDYLNYLNELYEKMAY